MLVYTDYPALRGFSLIGLALGALLLTGCATIPAPLAGDFPDFQPEQATERSIGARVRWGGQIIETRPESDRTCIEVLARDLDRDLRPLQGDLSRGRFLACRDGFQDPAIFSRGREITVIGRIDTLIDGSIGEFVYRYPMLDADTIYLWSRRSEHIILHDPWWPHLDPWWSWRAYHGVPHRRVSGRIIISQ